MLIELFVGCVVALPLATAATSAPLRARLHRHHIERRPGGRLNPVQADAVSAAVASVLTAGSNLSGNILQLPCSNCGRDRTPVPVEHARLHALPDGWQVVAACFMCKGPMITRVLPARTRDQMRDLGVPEVDGPPVARAS
jgi:hypothetical protein